MAETQAPEATPENTPVEPETAPAEPTNQEPAPEADTEDDPAAFDADRALAKIKKANAEAKQLRDRAKTAEATAADAAARAATLEEAAARVPDLETELIRERVARRFGLPDEFVDRLRGTTEDDVRADAEKLLADAQRLFGPKPPNTSTRPVESLQPGSGSTPAPTVDDQIAAAQSAGDWKQVLRLQNSKLANATPG